MSGCCLDAWSSRAPRSSRSTGAGEKLNVPSLYPAEELQRLLGQAVAGGAEVGQPPAWSDRLELSTVRSRRRGPRGDYDAVVGDLDLLN